MTKTKALENLIERAAALSDDARAEFVDAVADAMEQIETKHAGVYGLSEDERSVFRRARNAGA
jgi:hypothetical protein